MADFLKQKLSFAEGAREMPMGMISLKNTIAKAAEGSGSPEADRMIMGMLFFVGSFLTYQALICRIGILWQNRATGELDY
ncbi:MAG: hypothetical protein COV66_05540 [Nitrospinae bacterium CG11_big_fil_rev_8_21_14_0_20_45_15]|nr:MAG: hypothetical protein COV66_05540 [Nitrospinae bacterium CG11_big_fil_rev_8_21_14_0_20_45_15]